MKIIFLALLTFFTACSIIKPLTIAAVAATALSFEPTPTPEPTPLDEEI